MKSLFIAQRRKKERTSPSRILTAGTEKGDGMVVGIITLFTSMALSILDALNQSLVLTPPVTILTQSVYAMLEVWMPEEDPKIQEPHSRKPLSLDCFET